MAGRIKRSVVHLFMGGCTIVVTALVAHLMVPEPSRTDKFWLALGALLVAQGVWLLHRLATSFRHRMAATESQVRSGMSLVLMIYPLGVLLLALIAVSPIRFNWLLALHLLWALLPLLSFGSLVLASQTLDDTKGGTASRRS